MERIKRVLPGLFSLALIAALTAFSAGAAQGVRRALALCAEVIVPTLFPFFIASQLLVSSGLPRAAGRGLSGVASRLFRVPGAGVSALAVGLCGGYPLGAATVSELCRQGEITRAQAGKLLPLCNNSGPAFIIGAAGLGIFGSAQAGLMLYAIHILSAVSEGILMSGRGQTDATSALNISPPVKIAEKGAGVSEAIRASVWKVMTVCGFIAAFMALVGALDESGILPSPCGELSRITGAELSFCRALLVGFIELGGGVGAMGGMPPTARNLALCSFLLGWGGISVHMQTAAVCAGEKINTARHTVGRLLCGALSAAYTLIACALLRLPQI